MVVATVKQHTVTVAECLRRRVSVFLNIQIAFHFSRQQVSTMINIKSTVTLESTAEEILEEMEITNEGIQKTGCSIVAIFMC